MTETDKFHSGRAESLSDMSRVSVNEVTERIIGAAIEVHRHLGPGLLESAYEECLCQELTLRELPYERQKAVPVEYKGYRIDAGYRLDILVAGEIVVEVKAVDGILPVHEAQILSYLRLGGWSIGLLLNFHVPLLKQGVRRFVR